MTYIYRYKFKTFFLASILFNMVISLNISKRKYLFNKRLQHRYAGNSFSHLSVSYVKNKITFTGVSFDKVKKNHITHIKEVGVNTYLAKTEVDISNHTHPSGRQSPCGDEMEGQVLLRHNFAHWVFHVMCHFLGLFLQRSNGYLFISYIFHGWCTFWTIS